MTALNQYQRLESAALWRASPEAQRRQVHVSFGEATLVISDANGRALSHWSLPAIERRNPGARPALYAPGPDSDETLEIDEDLMIGAIETVRRALTRARPKSGRVRNAAISVFFTVVLGLAIFWLPGALIRQTLAVVPPAKRVQIGTSLLGHVQTIAGQSCRNPLGARALGRLQERVLGSASGAETVVLPEGPAFPLVLPGGIILLSRQMIDAADDPAVPAGQLLAGWILRSDRDPLEPVLRAAGLRATFRLLTTGDLPAGALLAHAQGLIDGPAQPARLSDLRAGFEATGLDFAAWAERVDPEGALYDLPADSSGGAEIATVPVLADADWIGLKGICRG